MDVVASFPPDAWSAKAVEPGDGPLDNPAVDSEPGSVRDSAAGDHRFHAHRPYEPTVLVVVVAAVAEQAVGALAWPSDQAVDRWDLLQQRYQLGDVVTITASQ
ncbi:hypothetical protein ADK52_14295 [Streptomyces sp. WM6372]|nr:hypothetical protein ADK52_14295 [Streptomyces sp. WM6372]